MKLWCLFLAFILVSCSNTATRKDIVSTSRNVQYDEIKPLDPNEFKPLWVTQFRAYKRKLTDQNKKETGNAFFKGQDNIKGRRNTDICYSGARQQAYVKMIENLRVVVKNDVARESKRLGDEVEKRQDDLSGRMSKDILRGVETRDEFYYEVKDQGGKNLIYCHVLLSINKSQLMHEVAKKLDLGKEFKERRMRMAEELSSILDRQTQ